MHRYMRVILALAFFLLAGCGAELDRQIPFLGGKADLETQLGKVFGPIEQRFVAGDGWVVLSPAANGTRELGYLRPGESGWQLQARHTLLADVGVTVEPAMVVIKSLKEGAPQFRAFRYGDDGLQPIDYYQAKAPEPAAPNGHFVLVNKQLNALWHYQNGKLIKAYRVATGRQTDPPAPTWEDYKTNFFTPEGDFRLTNFVKNPPFNALKPGDVSYAGGASGNPLGTRWMGFSVLDGDNAWVWGIHGTSAPELIGTWASDGCIRMHTQEVEELFELLKGQNVPLRVVAR